jgi:hypothetical protein
MRQVGVSFLRSPTPRKREEQRSARGLAPQLLGITKRDQAIVCDRERAA